VSAGSAPSPRSGKLMGGGPNALELLWASVALAGINLIGAVGTIVWAALWIDVRLAGGELTLVLGDMPGLLFATVTAGNLDEFAGQAAQPGRAATIAGVLAIGVFGSGWSLARRWWAWKTGWLHRRRASERIGSKVWASRRQLAALLTDRPRPTAGEPAASGRLLIGGFEHHDVLVPARTSVMVIAPTRTGKSTRLVVPNLLRWDGPAVVTSVKRDVYDLTVDRRSHGRPACLFDPTGSTGLPSVRWSPLLTSMSFPEATTTAGWLAEAASVEDKHEAAKFWQTLATKLLAPMLFAAANTRRTIHDVSHWVDRSAFDEVAAILNRLGDQDATAAWQAIRDLPVETRGSVLGTAMAIFRGFGSPRVRAATSCTPGDVGNTLNVAELLRDNGTLYLVSPEYEQAELRPVFVALVQAVYRAAVSLSANLLGGAPLSPPLLLMLDEAGNIAPLHSLPKIASTGAGQGITLMTIWQDRAQIRALYGDNERTVIANHTTSVWLPGSQDLDTLKLLADLIGDQWVASATVSSAADGGVSVSQGAERIDVAPPAFLRTLKHGHAVMLSGNTPPALVATQAYYEQRRWQRLIPTAQLQRYAAMHDGTGPTTASRWTQQRWNAALPDAPTHAEHTDDPDQAGHDRLLDSEPAEAGPEAEAAVVLANRLAHHTWGDAADAIPLSMPATPRPWGAIDLPAELSAQYGDTGRIDLTVAAVRRTLLPALLELGPAELVAAHCSLPQLVAEWPHLALSELQREVWEDCYPQLAGDPPFDDELPAF
jgi:type IV secretion system protein VirD4